MRETAAKAAIRAAENPGMWPPVVVPPLPAARPKRSVGDLSDEELMGKRYFYPSSFLLGSFLFFVQTIPCAAADFYAEERVIIYEKLL